MWYSVEQGAWSREQGAWSREQGVRRTYEIGISNKRILTGV